MTRFYISFEHVFLVSLFIVAFANLAYAAPEDRVREMVLSMPSVYKDQWIDLRSDSPLKDPRKLAAQFTAAYQFDRRLQDLESVQLLNEPIIVGLASDATVARYMQTRMGGRAVGDSMFASHANRFVDRPDFAWFVAAHELEHVEMTRLKAVEPRIPAYIFEGVASSLGDRYVMQSGKNTNYLVNATTKIGAYTGEDAQGVVTNFRLPSAVALFRSSDKLWMAEHLSGLFIEHLRSRSSLSPQIFFAKFGAVWQEVGRGTSFEVAFQRYFGFTLQSAEREFVDFMRNTENNFDARFRNTIYEDVPGSSHARRTR